MRYVLMTSVILTGIAVAIPGCERRSNADIDPPAIVAPQYDMIVLIMLDTSGSYAELLRTKGYPFCLHIINQMFVNRLGANDRLILGQISGTNDPLFWAGPPDALQKDFGSPKKFMDHLMNRPDPGASRVFSSMADGLEHVVGIPGVRERKSKVCAVFLTDMDDNFPDPDKSKARLLKAITEFAKTDSCMGIYWCDPRFQKSWQKHLVDCGVKNGIVDEKFSSSPKAPRFE